MKTVLLFWNNTTI